MVLFPQLVLHIDKVINTILNDIVCTYGVASTD